MNRRKAKFSRPTKVDHVKEELLSDEEDACGREVWAQAPPLPAPLPPPAAPGRFRVNPADAPITPPLTPPRLGGKAPTAQERAAHHTPPDEHACSGHMLLPPLPPAAPGRQQNRLPPAPGACYGPPRETSRTGAGIGSHPPLRNQQQQCTGASDLPLTAQTPHLYPSTPLNCTVNASPPRGRNTREQSQSREHWSAAPPPFKFPVDFSVPPPSISKTYSVPPNVQSLLGCTAIERTADSDLVNFSTSNVSQSHMSHSQERTQIVPQTYAPETRASKQNIVSPFHFTPAASSQPSLPEHHFPPPHVSQANSNNSLVPLHYQTDTKVPPHEKPPRVSQHHMPAHLTSHSHVTARHCYPYSTQFPHTPSTNVPPTHGKSPHNSQQRRSHSRRVTEHSTSHYRPQNVETQLSVAGSYKNTSSELPFPNNIGRHHTFYDAPRDDNQCYRRENCEASSVEGNLSNLLNSWVPPPLQIPQSRPPPLPPPPPHQQMEPPHLLAMPTPPPEQQEQSLSPTGGPLYFGNGHHYQNYQGHQQFYNQQSTSSPLRVAEYHQRHYTDRERSSDTTVWKPSEPQWLTGNQVPVLLHSGMENSTMQRDYYRSPRPWNGSRSRTGIRPNRRVRQVKELPREAESTDALVQNQCLDYINQQMYEKTAEAYAVAAACFAAKRTADAAAAAAAAGQTATGMPALPAPPVFPALTAPPVLPALMAAPCPSIAATSARLDSGEGNVKKKPRYSRKKDEPATDVTDHLTVPITNDDPTSAMASQYRALYNMYMKGSFGDTLHVHQGQLSLGVPPKDPQTGLSSSTGQVMDVATREMNNGLLSSGGRLILPDPYPSVAPFLGLQSTPEERESFMKSFWTSVYQQQALKLGLLPMLQPNLTSNADKLGTHLYQQMMGHKDFRHALAELDHQILARGSLGSSMPPAALPPPSSIHSSTAAAHSNYDSSLAQYTNSGTVATFPSHQSDFLRLALQDNHSSAQTPSLPACSSSGCCNNANFKTAKKEQQRKDLELLKLFQRQQLQRKMSVDTVRQMNEETFRRVTEHLQQQQLRQNEEERMKRLNEEFQKQVIQAHIDQERQSQRTRQKKKTLTQLQEKTEEADALKDALCSSFLQKYRNEHGMIGESQHLETKSHQDVNLQLNKVKAKRGCKRKSEPLEQESTMQCAINLERHRASPRSLVGGMQRSVIVHGKEYVNQMSQSTYQQQLHYLNSENMKASQRELSENVKREGQNVSQLTQLLMQGQSERDKYQQAYVQEQTEALRPSKLAAEHIVTEPRHVKQLEIPHNIPNKKAMYMQNLFTDLQAQQELSGQIKQEPMSSPTEATVIKPKEEREDQLDLWCSSNVNMEKVAEDLQQAQFGVELQQKHLSFSHHEAASSPQADSSQGLDLSSQRHVPNRMYDNITIKTEEDAEEISDQTTNQQNQETLELLEELDEIKLDTLQQQNTDQQQNLLELPSFGSYLNVDGIEEADVEEADLNAAYHAVVSLQQSEIPDLPATPPSQTTRTSEYCQSSMCGSTVSNLSKTMQQLNEDNGCSKAIQRVSVVQMPQRSPPVSVQKKTVQQKRLRRTRTSFKKEEDTDTVVTLDCTYRSDSDISQVVTPSLDKRSHSQPVSLCNSIHKQTYTLPEAVTDSTRATVPRGVITRNSVLIAAAARNSREAMNALQKSTHDISVAENLTVPAKVATSPKAQASLQVVSIDSVSATDMALVTAAVETSDKVQRTRKGVKRKYSTRRAKK